MCVATHTNVTYLISVNLDNVYKYVCRPATGQLMLRYERRHNSSVGDQRIHNKFCTLNPPVFITLRIQITKLRSPSFTITSDILEKKEIKLLMFGLVGAGKRTILYKLRLTENNKPISTIGFNLETLEYKDNIYSCNYSKREY